MGVPAPAAAELVVPGEAGQGKELEGQRAAVAKEKEDRLEECPLASGWMSRRGIGMKTTAQSLRAVGEGRGYETPGQHAA